MTTRIKICGITNTEDAEAAVACGADYLGLIFVSNSSRHVTLESAEPIVKAVAGLAKIVGVFQNQSVENVNQTANRLGLDIVQLHGHETVEYCHQVTVPVMKVFELDDQFEFDSVKPFLACVKYVLFDRPKQNTDPEWHSKRTTILKQSPEWLPSSFIAGGLDAEAVRLTISELHPYAVDVASGIESKPGKKDLSKMRSFCAAVHGETKTCKP